ncbi:class IV adenylate cyclase [Limnoglobus roseus]|uniref:Class IV adenylate cyclase n=1 Tax=Limnoglobus roseus TaxID=2598579 RepID=A0A5C1A4L2_9BACT|nr:class IV adenylate cyclase [Limnoglobus roseus]QEL13600.1 class IV adenylate cyclase [Limnoglobus roseus]
MLEIELKFRFDDWERAKQQVQEWGGRFLESRRERDHYFNAPDRDFRTTDEVFRLRCVDEVGILTYKGPKRGGGVKTRPEIEVPLATGTVTLADAEKLILALGYRATAVVMKQRETYTLQRDGFELHLCFDHLGGVGRFVEIEIVTDESRTAEAAAVVEAVAKDLNLTVPEPRAYLRMVLDAKGIDA